MNYFSKVKKWNNWLDNHIEHLVDTNDKIPGIKPEDGKYHPNQLDWEHCHSRFNYYEDDGLEFAIAPASTQISILGSRSNPQIDLDNSNHNQTRNNGIHSQGNCKACQS